MRKVLCLYLMTILTIGIGGSVLAENEVKALYLTKALRTSKNTK